MTARIPFLLAAGLLLAAALPAAATAQAEASVAEAPETVPAPEPENAAALQRARQRFVRAFSGSTPARLVSAFAPGGRAVSNNGVVQPSTFADLAVALGTRNATWTQNELTVHAATRVLERGSYRFQTNRVHFRGDYTISWVYRDGDWLVQELRMIHH